MAWQHCILDLFLRIAHDVEQVLDGLHEDMYVVCSKGTAGWDDRPASGAPGATLSSGMGGASFLPRLRFSPSA